MNTPQETQPQHENDFVKVHPGKPRWDHSTVMVEHKFIPDPRAEFAMQLMKHFALVAASPDGEDTGGRQKLRRQLPPDIVNHCVDVATIAFGRFFELGWLVCAPAIVSENIDEKLIATGLEIAKAKADLKKLRDEITPKPCPPDATEPPAGA